jgi:hypothetical protein
MNVKELVEVGHQLFAKKKPLDSLLQEIAEHFYPERADFTIQRSAGADFASNLMTSYPVLCRRDLGNQFSTMLRPVAKPWFHPARRFSNKKEDTETRRYLQWFEEVMRRAMYDQRSLFTKAMKEGDHDIAAFGQCAFSVELNKRADGLLFRSWHLSDLAWEDDEEGQICYVFRRWRPTAQVLVRLFGDKVNPKVKDIAAKTPFEEVDVYHMVVDSDLYDDKAGGRPRWSIWYDLANEHVMEARPIFGKHYIIPRWQTPHGRKWGSQYGTSPAVIAALPDARLIQAMTYTLLEAGEKATSPPMIATKDAVRSDVALYAGGITWVDPDYDEKLGEALRPLQQDFRGFNFGTQLNQDTRQLIHKAFYLDTLTIPQRTPEMTAYEVGQRVQQYIRDALPLFEPLEHQCNGQICEEVFGLLMRNGAFGSPQNFPRTMRGMDVDFRFESPLHDEIEKQKVQQWMEGKTLIADAVALDPSTAFLVDAKIGLRDVLGAIMPSDWIRTEAEVDELVQQQEQVAQGQALLAALEQGSVATANLAGAQKDMAAAQAQGAAI